MRLRSTDRRKRSTTTAAPAQIYLREAGRRRTPWALVGLVAVLVIIGGAALYALAVGAF